MLAHRKGTKEVTPTTARNFRYEFIPLHADNGRKILCEILEKHLQEINSMLGIIGGSARQNDPKHTITVPKNSLRKISQK